MKTFTQHTLQSAPAGAKPILQEIQEKYGFIPNLFATFAEAPAVLEAYLALSGALEKGALDPEERQIVLIAASFENVCTYCVAAHSTTARMQHVPVVVLHAIRNGTPLPDKKLDALVTLTRRVVRQRGRVSGAEVAQFLDAGYTKAQLLEVIGHVGLKTISNYVNHIADTPLDHAFQAQAWEPRPAEAA